MFLKFRRQSIKITEDLSVLDCDAASTEPHEFHVFLGLGLKIKTLRPFETTVFTNRHGKTKQKTVVCNFQQHSRENLKSRILLLLSVRQNPHRPVRIQLIVRLAHCTILFGIINVSYGKNEIGF